MVLVKALEIKFQGGGGPVPLVHPLDPPLLLPQNVSFLECFWPSHIYFIRYCNNPTEITRSHYFCDVFLKNKTYLPEMFLASFLRCFGKGIFFEMFLRRLKDVTKKTSLLRCFWEVSEISLSMEIWLRSLRDISCRLGNTRTRVR